MRQTESFHPTLPCLRDFMDGRLQGDEFTEVEKHIEYCQECCEKLTDQPNNTLLALAREVATMGPLARVAEALLADEAIPTPLVDHPRYRVIEQIGMGGMGAVYKAEHRLMRRIVALKVVHPRLLSNPSAVERFEREVHLAAKLSHPNIVVSYDADEAGGLHFLAMEYVEGETLDVRIDREGPASVKQACGWIEQAALGLEHARERGMAHRDIKPANLMITPEGEVRILDFGLSRIVKERVSPSETTSSPVTNGSETRTDMILGTPDYVAPEQIVESSCADIRSDIYSLGCSLYFLLTGKSPFHHRNISGKLSAHQKEPFPDIRKHRSDVPDALHAVLTRMTAKDPEARFQTPAEVAESLQVIVESLEKPNESPREADGAVSWLGRLPMRSRVGMAAAIGLALLLVPLTVNQWLEPPPIGSKGHLLVLLPSKGLWFPDYEELVLAAQVSGVRLTFAGLGDGPSDVLATSKPGVAVPDRKLDSAVVSEPYDGIVFIGYRTEEFQPGGVGGADAARLINEFQMDKKILGAVCAGQRVLAQHGALRGKQVTPAVSVHSDEIKYGGASRTKDNVVMDGNVVTAAEARFAGEFMRSVTSAIARKSTTL
jgi:putative intracellular protease/amidase/predicted Ser/Thr protein kinase